MSAKTQAQAAAVEAFGSEDQAKAVIRALLAQMRSEGADFYYNQPNNYGSITMHVHTGKGDAFELYAGKPQLSRYGTRNGGVEERPNGYYGYNERLVDYLYGLITKAQQ